MKIALCRMHQSKRLSETKKVNQNCFLFKYNRSSSSSSNNNNYNTNVDVSDKGRKFMKETNTFEHKVYTQIEHERSVPKGNFCKFRFDHWKNQKMVKPAYLINLNILALVSLIVFASSDVLWLITWFEDFISPQPIQLQVITLY